MKTTIIGGGNMGSAIAHGLAAGSIIAAKDIYVIDPTQKTIDQIKKKNDEINAVVSDYESLKTADIVIVAVKPWLVNEILSEHKSKLNSKQIIVSIAAGITLSQLDASTQTNTPLFRLVPNTAIAIRQSMTFISSLNATDEQIKLITDIFDELGGTNVIKENLIPAATALSSCGIAYAFRYIRAAMEGGVEMGFYPEQSKEIVIQTLRGAIELLEENKSHPEVEIDKVTTAGGITIKGLNEMEHSGFTSAVIKGLKASHVK